MNTEFPEALKQIVKNLKLLILDVDGVMTSGKIYVCANGDEMIAFNAQDGIGIRRLQASGVTVAVISGRDTKAVRHRLDRLGIQHVFLGQIDKIPAYQTLVEKLSVAPEQIAYIGDDLPDIPIMERVGLSVAVKNAVSAVKQMAKWQTQTKGGKGAVREICDLIYEAQQSTTRP